MTTEITPAPRAQAAGPWAKFKADLRELATDMRCAFGRHDFIKQEEWRYAGLGLIIVGGPSNIYHQDHFVLTCRHCAARRRITESQRGRGAEAQPIETRDVTEQLKFRDHGKITLEIAIEAGSVDLVAKIIKRSNVNAWLDAPEFSKRTTILHAAVICGNLDVLRVVLSHPDLDPNKAKGDSALALALNGDRRVAVDLLLSHPRINPNAANPLDGFTPLHHAVRSGSMHALEALLAREDVDLNAVARCGKTALEMAREKDAGSMVDAILARMSKDEAKEIESACARPGERAPRKTRRTL